MTWEASQLAIDRLDFVSALLAIVAIVLAVGIFPLFGFLRHRAEQVAKEAAKEEIEGLMVNLEKEAISRIESMLPALIRDYMSFVQDNPVDDDAANAIAGAQEVKTDAADTRDPESPGEGPG